MTETSKPLPEEAVTDAMIEHVISEAGATAYLACLKAGKAEYRTHRLGLRRPAYDVNFAAAASDAVKEYLTAALPAIAAAARQSGDGETRLDAKHDSAAIAQKGQGK